MDVAEDIARLAKENSARLVPESGPVGYYLRKTGNGPEDYEFVQGPRSEILDGTGDPNGVHEAPMGTLYVERDAPALWQNDDGQTVWHQVGANAAAGSGAWADLTSDGTTANATDTTENLIPNGASIISGADISEGSAGDIALINTDGIYSVTASVRAVATTGGDTYHTALFALYINEETGHPQPIFQDLKGAALVSTKHQANSTLSWSGFLGATSSISVQGSLFGGGAETWDWSGHVLVNRLA